MKCSIATWIDAVRARPCLWFMLSKREYLFSFVIYCHLIHIMHTTDVWPLIHWVYMNNVVTFVKHSHFFSSWQTSFFRFSLPSEEKERRKKSHQNKLFEPLLTSSFIFFASNFAWPFIIWSWPFCIVFVNELESGWFHRFHLKWFCGGTQRRKKNRNYINVKIMGDEISRCHICTIFA